MKKGARGQHVGKTEEERQEYFNRVISRQPSPTLDDFGRGDATDRLQRPERTYQSERGPARWSFGASLGSYVRENGIVIVGGIAWACLAAFLGFLYHLESGTHEMATTLNREVGALGSKVDSHVETSADSARRLEARIDKLEDRVNGYIERTLREGHPGGGSAKEAAP